MATNGMTRDELGKLAWQTFWHITADNQYAQEGWAKTTQYAKEPWMRMAETLFDAGRASLESALEKMK